MEFQKNINLSGYSNYRIGGPAKFFFEAGSATEVAEVVAAAGKLGLDFFVLGGGTNLLVNDRGFDGLVLRPKINFLHVVGEVIKAGAGVSMPDLVSFAAEKGLSGLEWAGGLPGTLGGAIRGNAGAFGGEIKDVVLAVESLDTQNLQQIVRKNSDCRFAYRTSIFKERNGEEIILSATLALAKGDPKKIAAAANEKINYRLSRHPMEYPNIGSIFKNVDLGKVPAGLHPQFAKVIKVDPFPVVPTAYLISEAGLKGVSFGGAMVSPKHPNFIVNVLNATFFDVTQLIDLVRGEVDKKFGIKLEEEIQLL